MRRPVRVNVGLTDKLRTLLPLFGIEPAPGYVVFVTNTKRGRCNYDNKTITVPSWAMQYAPRTLKPNAVYKLYYAAHECAHSWCFEECGERAHGATFMDWFKHVCLNHLHHYEIGYKPRLAVAAGISKRNTL